MSVVITSLALRTPLGCSLQEAFQNIEEERRSIAPIENYSSSELLFNGAGEVRRGGRVVKSPPSVDRKILFLEECLNELIQNSDTLSRYSPNDIALNVGGGVNYLNIERLFRHNRSVDLDNLIDSCHYKNFDGVVEVAKRLPVLGGINLFTAACVASTQAIGTSYRMIKKGYRKAAITGGSDSMINHINYKGFLDLGAMVTEYEPPFACRPFDKSRKGTVLGEGALLMLLEKRAEANPNSIIAEIVGYGTTMDAYAITAPDPTAQSLANAIEKALLDADLTKDKIDAVHLHGTGTPKNAPAEYRALKSVFGERVTTLPVFSLKGQIGHLIGSCGAVEMVGVIHSLQNQKIMPTLNFFESDPEAPLNVIKDRAKEMKIEYILKLNSSFGGENTALIIKKV